MTTAPSYLITGAGGGVGGISRLVVEHLLAHQLAVRAMVHHDDTRAEALRDLGADVIVGDLTNPVHVAAASPAALDIDELAREYSRALGRPIAAAHLSYDE
ncbi:NAD(P)H-binding protein [Saccharopolyspora sp. NPDC003752]